MSEQQRAVLRVEPHAIPALRAAYDKAVLQIGRVLEQGRRGAYISEPWLGDPISLAVTRLYNGRFATGSGGSAVDRLAAYQDQLVRIRDALTEMEDRYRRTEGENSDLWGRLA